MQRNAARAPAKLAKCSDCSGWGLGLYGLLCPNRGRCWGIRCSPQAEGSLQPRGRSCHLGSETHTHTHSGYAGLHSSQLGLFP